MAGYFTYKLQELLNPNKEMEFTDYIAVGGLLELSRQYKSMPDGIKELSAQGLKESILNVIDKHGTLISYKDYFPQKEIKALLLNLYLISRTKKDKYFEKLFDYLSDFKTNKGILKAIKYIVDKCDEPEKFNIEKDDIYNLINDLLFLLIEYLDYRGHTLSVIYRSCKQINNQGDIYDYFEKIYNQIKELIFKEIKKFDLLEFKIIVSCEENHVSLYNKFLNKVLCRLKDENRIMFKNYEEDTRYTRSRNESEVLITKKYSIYNIDENYTDRLNKDIYVQIKDFLTRTFKKSTNVYIYRLKNGKALLIDKPGKSKNIKLHIKYYNQYCRSEKFLNISGYRYEEINRINEWIKVIENSPRNHIAYNSFMEYFRIPISRQCL